MRCSNQFIPYLCILKCKIYIIELQNAEHDIKEMIKFISQLKSEITTNKPLKPLRLNPKAETNDAEEWNKYLEYRTHIEGQVTWFNTLWLYCESYMYRVLAQEIGLM